MNPAGNRITYNGHAGDTKIYTALSPVNYSPVDALRKCVMHNWMCQNILQVNQNITELTIFCSKDERLKILPPNYSSECHTKQVRCHGVLKVK